MNVTKNHLMKHLLLIITILLCIACSNKKAKQAKDLIHHSEDLLIYKYDSLSQSFLIFSIPSMADFNHLKPLLSFDVNHQTSKPISPTYRFDLLTKEEVQGEILIEQSQTPFLTIKSNAFEISSRLEDGLKNYLKALQQNVYTTKDSVQLAFQLKGELENVQWVFNKASDSLPYSEFSVRQNYQTEHQQKHDLTSIMQYTAIFWIAANRDAPLELQKVYVGSPLSYNDVQKRHIKVFQHSSKWKAHLKEKGRTVDYQLVADIMLETDVYKPLNDFLKLKGFEIINISLEKVGLIPSKLLEDDGLNNNGIIPTPHMVWIEIGKTSAKTN